MATIKHIFKGESLTILLTFPEAYDMSRIEKHEIYIGATAFTGVVSGQTVELKLTSEQTDVMYGRQEIRLWLDDSVLGVKKPYCGEIIVSNSNAKPANDSTSSVSDIIIPIIISETAITVGDVLYNYVKGDKGDKGDPFLYSDFTPEQIAELQQPAADAIASIEAVEQSVEQAEALRVTAEQARQTNTATAIQNAETATTNANNAAGLANEKAGLADQKATLADHKATLANIAATLANEVANNPDKVVADYWHKWNTTTKAYENTGIKAKGADGKSAYQSYFDTTTDNPKLTEAQWSENQQPIIFPDVLLDGNTVGWYDSQDLSTIEKNVTELVSKWKDKLGSGRDLVQATDTKKPKYEFGDGLHFNFDSADDKLAATFTYAQPSMMYLVIKDNVYGTGGRFTDGATGNTNLLGYSGSNEFAAFGGSSWSAASRNVEVKSWTIVRVLYNGANSKLIINRTLPITGDWGSTAAGGFTLGNRGDVTANGENFNCREVILRNVTDTQINEDAIYNYLCEKYRMNELIILGDSTVANNYSQKAIWEWMTTDISCIDNSAGSSSNEAQKALLLKTASSKTKVVIIMLGLNNLTMTTPEIITSYQSMVNAARSIIGTNGKIIINTMIPCKFNLDSKYIALNEAILGNGATPIIGVDARIDTVNTVLNAGDGTLNQTYGIGDGLHENDLGRQVIAALWDAKLTEFGY